MCVIYMQKLIMVYMKMHRCNADTNYVIRNYKQNLDEPRGITVHQLEKRFRH